MISLRQTIVLSLIALAYGSPVYPPPAELDSAVVDTNISTIAGGGLSSGTSRITVTPEGLTGLALLVFLENLEAYLYSDALNNITSGRWNTTGQPLDNVAEVIEKIAAQEEVHVATVAGALLENNATLVPPCKYTFPSTNLDEFLAVANLITCANFGSIIGLQEQLGSSNPSLMAPSSAILGSETRHDSFLRILRGSVPNPAPFETGIPLAWALNIGYQYVVPGSCPVEVALPIYPRLYMNASNTIPSFAYTPYPATVAVNWATDQQWSVQTAGKQLYAAWLNLNNAPVYTNVTLLEPGVGSVPVPGNMSGVAFFALTTIQPTDFTNLQGATLAGPLAIAIS